jgi:hypothetical protein
MSENGGRVAWGPVMKWLLPEVTGLSYKPSTRYAYYRVMDHFGLGKKGWSGFKSVQSRWRKSFRDGWSPDTFADSIRGWDPNGYGAITETGWFDAMVENAPQSGVWNRLDFYVEVWFEAEAMSGQFDAYVATPFRIPTVPFRGDYTVAPKWERADIIRRQAKAGRKVTILYFGDLDKKGRQIPISALDDIREWAKAQFEFHLCGLTREQAEEFHLKENFERPGEFQWEGVDDKAAKKIIEGSLREYVPLARLKRAVTEAIADEGRWRERAKELLTPKGSPSPNP